MIHSSCSSDPKIRRRSAMTPSAMQSLDRHLWRSRITNKTKLHLYRVFVLPIMLYGSECWAINKADIHRVDAVDQWCLRRIMDINFAGTTLSETPTTVALPTITLSCIWYWIRLRLSFDVYQSMLSFLNEACGTSTAAGLFFSSTPNCSLLRYLMRSRTSGFSSCVFIRSACHQRKHSDCEASTPTTSDILMRQHQKLFYFMFSFLINVLLAYPPAWSAVENGLIKCCCFILF